jgi:hypothetical protein
MSLSLNVFFGNVGYLLVVAVVVVGGVAVEKDVKNDKYRNIIIIYNFCNDEKLLLTSQLKYKLVTIRTFFVWSGKIEIRRRKWWSFRMKSDKVILHKSGSFLIII